LHILAGVATSGATGTVQVGGTMQSGDLTSPTLSEANGVWSYKYHMNLMCVHEHNVAST